MSQLARNIKTRITSRTWRIAFLLGLAISLAGAGRRPYGIHDKISYATQATIDFLRPGLVITVNSASIAADGTITATYTLSDPAGLPLDSAGVYTPGPITVSLVAAYLPANSDQYTSYTTRVSKGTAGTFTNAGPDAGGVTTALGNGQYTYVFHTQAPAGFDANATTTIGVYGRRTMTAFNIPNNMASTVYTFVPNGSPVTHVRDVVETAACNACHDQLSHHGGQRRQVALCILCHQPQSHEEVLGTTVDFKVMIHKLHMGSQLPSVKAGGKDQINDEDFTGVVFPADPRRCETCHSQKLGAAQATNYLTKPSRAACGACHDDVNFATGVNHPGGPQIDDNQCASCHVPQGELPFDASIKGAHLIPIDSPDLGGIQVALTGITNGAAGQKPTVAFTMTDKSGAPLPMSKVAQLAFTMAGPTSDYGYTSFGSDVTTHGYVQESAVAGAVCGADGSCTYTFTHAVPANAKGTYAIGMEGRRTEVLMAGTTSQTSVNYSPPNKVLYFSVDGSPVVNRRVVVAIANCNRCHVELNHHGGRRNDTLYCVLCHNPSNTDNSTPVAQGVNFNLLIHRIHTGENLVALGKSYTVSGTDFTKILYSAMDPSGNAGDTRNCSLCHVNGSEQKLPLGLNPVTDPQGPVNPDLPITAACTACHANLTAVGHALSNTSSVSGETCTVCHNSAPVYGVVPPFAVTTVHAQY